MKKIEALIRLEKLKDVVARLDAVGYPGITISMVEGHGRQRGVTGRQNGKPSQGGFHPKIKLEIVAKDQDAPKIVKAICSSAKTNAIGDGKIFIYDVSQAIRIRTEEEGEIALGHE